MGSTVGRGLCALVGAPLVSGIWPASASARPNIVYILADDLALEP
jgi:hypothetical protein